MMYIGSVNGNKEKGAAGTGLAFSISVNVFVNLRAQDAVSELHSIVDGIGIFSGTAGIISDLNSRRKRKSCVP